jgi:hypothetical protein
MQHTAMIVVKIATASIAFPPDEELFGATEV